MKEESQIHDMRAALQGERERAEQARQRSTENVLALYASEPEEPDEPDEPEPEAPVRRSLLGRLLGR